ncbi:MAG: SAM-dependent chlorinase/fluorinase [Actinobacteria bacterium]|nr:SAM-dependent chlorinase/fluorinase [Actinomycetota bacterium]
MSEPFVGFCSDYGTVDEFVGVCKGVIASIAPRARVVDLTHDLPPHDVAAGALALLRSVQYLPEGSLVLAVVDPGVGTDRRLVAVECEEATLFGPDNGLLAPAVAVLGGAGRVVALTDAEYHLPAPGPTFAGRDVLAPALAHHAAGVALEDLGEAVDPATLMPGLVGLPRFTPGGAVEAQVWWVDRFGNCQLNVGPEELAALGATPDGRIEVRTDGGVRVARWVHTYADAKPSELALLVDSYGLCALALNRRSAAAELGLTGSAPVTLVPPGATVD